MLSNTLKFLNICISSSLPFLDSGTLEAVKHGKLPLANLIKFCPILKELVSPDYLIVKYWMQNFATFPAISFALFILTLNGTGGKYVLYSTVYKPTHGRTDRREVQNSC